MQAGSWKLSESGPGEAAHRGGKMVMCGPKRGGADGAGRGGADCGASGEDVVPLRCRRPPVYPNGGGKHSENLSALANCTCRSLPSCHPLPGGKIVAGDGKKEVILENFSIRNLAHQLG